MRKQGDDAATSRAVDADPEATRMIPRLAPGGLYWEGRRLRKFIKAPMRKQGDDAAASRAVDAGAVQRG